MSFDLVQGLGYVKEATCSTIPTYNSVHWIDIEFSTGIVSLIASKIKEQPYTTLITNDFSLHFNGKALILSSNTDSIELDQIDDINITEERLFQMSSLKDFSSVTYEDIVFVKNVYGRLIQG